MIALRNAAELLLFLLLILAPLYLAEIFLP